MSSTPADELLEGPLLILRCREIHEISQEVSRIIEDHLRSIAKPELSYTFKSRHKGCNNILEKVRRKRAEGHENGEPRLVTYSPDDVSDAWACRFVTLYQREIPRVVDKLLAGIEHFNEHSSYPEPVRLVEFVIYSNRPKGDPLSIVPEVTEIFAKSHKESFEQQEPLIRAPENKKSAYSSVHLVFSLDVTIYIPDKGRTKETGKFEVQIRDIFEEGWGEIQHNLIYSRKETSASGISERHDSLWRPHLNALKTFVDGCSQHASIIRSSYEYTHLQRLPSIDMSATSREEDMAAIVAKVKRTPMSPVAPKIELAYGLLIDAHNDEQGGDIATENYLVAAAKFEEVINSVGNVALEKVPEKRGRTIEYFLKLELANSFINAGHRTTPEQIETARRYLDDLSGRFPNDAMIPLRLSQLIIAIDADKKAVQLAIDTLNSCIARIPADNFLEPHSPIDLSARVHLGYLHWRLSELHLVDEDASRRKEELDLAIERSKDAIMRWRLEPEHVAEGELHRLFAHKGTANTLYYLARLAAMGEKREADIRHYVKVFHSIEVPGYREFFKTRDSLMHALYAIDQRDEAVKYAYENRADLVALAEHRAGRRLANNEIESYLVPLEKPSFRAAERVIAGQSPRDDDSPYSAV